VIYVLTRFAEKFSADAPDFTPEWLRSRVELLSERTSRSLWNQTEQGFDWLVSVYQGIASDVEADIMKATQGRARLVQQAPKAETEDVFRSYLSQVEGRYWTVRLDSDDMLHPEFLATLKRAQAQRGMIQSFPKGAILDVERGVVAVRRLTNNPFLAQVGENGENVFDLGHHGEVSFRPGVKFHTRQTREPMWLQVVHGQNLANAISDWDRPVLRGGFLRRFGLSEIALDKRERFNYKKWIVYLRYVLYFVVKRVRR
jgi:hypothetical protein